MLLPAAEATATTLALTDVRIDTTRGDGDGLGGDGLYVRGDGEVSGSGLEIRGTRQAGLRLGPDASATLSGVWIANTDTMVCANGGCAESDAAVGVYVDGFFVKKSNLYDAETGERSVWDQELASDRDAAAAFRRLLR